MGGLASTIKLGPVGSELSINTDALGLEYMTGGFSIKSRNEQAQSLNINKEKFTVLYRRLSKDYSLQFDDCSEDFMWALDSLNVLQDQNLSFIYANAWKVNSESYLTTSTTKLTLKTNPHLLLDQAYNAISGAAQVTITGVFTNADLKGAQATTNYYTSGSFNRATWEITLGSSPGAAGTRVYVNYTYTGALVKLNGGVQVDKAGWHPTSSAPLWNARINLTSI